jgi:predicted neuraminidase
MLKTEFIDPSPAVPSCHASTIVETHDGALAAAWFAGSGEGLPDVCIWLSRCEGGVWTSPEIVADGVLGPKDRLPCYNPVLFQPEDGPLLLFYKIGPYVAGWQGWMKRSPDGGRTWSAPEPLPDGMLGPSKNKPVQLANGDILCPSSDEKHGWSIHFERTSDLGKTWTTTDPLNDPAKVMAIQPSILFHSPTQLQAIGRTQSGKLFTISSSDTGRTWGPTALLDVPNPNSGTDAVTLKNGLFLLVYNATPQDRTPLNVALSRDGIRWFPALTLEDQPGEYSYPAVIQTRDGDIHITYTWHRRKIKHVVLDHSALEAAFLVQAQDRA